MAYQLLKNYFPDGSINPESVAVLKDGYITIPFDLANIDYAKFKKEILANEAQLKDADDNNMTAEEVEVYVATLP